LKKGITAAALVYYVGNQRPIHPQLAIESLALMPHVLVVFLQLKSRHRAPPLVELVLCEIAFAITSALPIEMHGEGEEHEYGEGDGRHCQDDGEDHKEQENLQ
jgi:hypothetical protein